MKRITLIFLLLVFGFYSCKKETPADYPSVQITSPYFEAIFNELGNITVQAHVSDGQHLSAISVCVANSQSTPVLASAQIPVTSNDMNISCNYSLYDIHLNSGVYFVMVSASNGTNITNAFQQIYIVGVPEKRTAIYAITRNSAGVHAWKIDSAFRVTLSYTVAGDYSSSDVNSWYQQLYTTGYDSGSATAYSVPNPSVAWNIAGISSPPPYFTNVYCYGDAAYISYYEGFIKYFDHTGALQFTCNTANGFYPVKTYRWNGFLFAEERDISSPKVDIATYNPISGGLTNLYQLPGPLVAMYGLDNSHLFLFGNSTAGAPYMLDYNIQGNVSYAPILTLPSAQILSVALINPGTYLIAFSNGTIYQYSYNGNNLFPYINGITASCVRYDSIDAEVITSSGKVVSEYNYSSGGLIISAAIPDSVRDVRILYNK